MVINELPRITDVLFFEEGEEVNFVRDVVTVPSGTAACSVGQVLGMQKIGPASSAAKTGGNTGAGTLTMDATTPELANVKVGVYTVSVLAVGTVTVTDPNGAIVGEFTYGAGATVTFANELKFAFTDDGTTHFVAGDGFVVTVAAGPGKYVPVNATAIDGTQNAAAVLLAGFAATLAADTAFVVADRGPCGLKATGLLFPSGATAPQIANWTAQLTALGMIVQAGFGV